MFSLSLQASNLILSNWISLFIFKDEIEQRKKEDEKRMQEFEQQILEWQRAVEHWESMYYCFRDDVVFVEGDYWGVKPSQTIAYAYRRA